jgi:hypothetical protein
METKRKNAVRIKIAHGWLTDDEIKNLPMRRYENPPDLPIESLKILARNYERTGDPILLMSAFANAVEYNLGIPVSVIRKLHQVFRDYLNKKSKKPSLDRLLGLTGGKGQARAWQNLERRNRDVKLYTDMTVLIRQFGINVTDAAKITVEYNRKLVPPNPRTVQQDYYKERWRFKKFRPRLGRTPDLFKAAKDWFNGLPEIERERKKKLQSILKRFSNNPA